MSEAARALACAALIAAGALASGCSGGGAPAEPVRSAPPFSVSVSRSADAAPATAVSRRTGVAVERGRLAHLTRRTELRARPGGRVLARLGRRTEFGSPRVLSVTGERDGWLRVLAAELANGKSGWIPAAAARTGRTGWSVRIDRSERRLVLRRGGERVATMPVAVGRPENPTPLGRFAVTDKLEPEDPASPYGCCIVALTGHQTRLAEGWPGGDRLAIHHTPAEHTVGTAASLGCLRARRADVRRLMRRLPLGAPVFIRD